MEKRKVIAYSGIVILLGFATANNLTLIERISEKDKQLSENSVIMIEHQEKMINIEQHLMKEAAYSDMLTFQIEEQKKELEKASEDLEEIIKSKAALESDVQYFKTKFEAEELKNSSLEDELTSLKNQRSP